MSTNPLISVIVPVYNQKKFLNDCLESINKQTYDKLEVLLIDDGSSDGSGEICDEWRKRDKRVRVFHTKNEGVSNARNIGLANSNGELISFVDPDDWIEEDAISQMVKIMIYYKVDLAFFKYDEFSSKNDIEINKRENSLVELYKRKDIVKFILKEDKLTNHVWRGIYKNKLIKPNIFPKGKNYEDMYSMLEFIKPCSEIAVSDNILYHHRISKKAITSTWDFNNCIDCCDASAHESELTLYLYPELRIDVNNKVVRDCLYVWNNAVRSRMSRKCFRNILRKINKLLDRYYIDTNHSLQVKLQIYIIRHVEIGNRLCNRLIYGLLKVTKWVNKGER